MKKKKKKQKKIIRSAPVIEMNSTSPGQQKHFPSGTLATISFTPQPPTFTTHDDVVKCSMSKVSSLEQLERLYDDPCELMMEGDWNSPARLPRSRSWLCCPQPRKPDDNDPTSGNIHQLFDREFLITEAPKLGQSSV